MDNIKDFNLINAPRDVYADILAKQAQLADSLGVSPRKVGRGGGTLRYLLCMTKRAEAMGVQLDPSEWATE